MVSVTLAVPEELKKKMDYFPEINWSVVAREAFNRKVSDLELLNKIKENSTLTEEDAIKLGRELKKKMAKKDEETGRRR